ncbi:auxin-binding protein ABP19a-like protein [Tanacetum coccineum]
MPVCCLSVQVTQLQPEKLYTKRQALTPFTSETTYQALNSRSKLRPEQVGQGDSHGFFGKNFLSRKFGIDIGYSECGARILSHSRSVWIKFSNAKGYKSKNSNYMGLGCNARIYDHRFAVLKVLADAMSVLKDFVSSSQNFVANTSNIIKATATSAFAAQLLGVNGLGISIALLDLALIITESTPQSASSNVHTNGKQRFAFIVLVIPSDVRFDKETLEELFETTKLGRSLHHQQLERYSIISFARMEEVIVSPPVHKKLLLGSLSHIKRTGEEGFRQKDKVLKSLEAKVQLYPLIRRR